MTRFWLWLVLMLWIAGNAVAQDFSALARIKGDNSSLTDHGDHVELRLNLSQAVPFRIFSLDEPRRIVIDFNELDWTGLDPIEFDRSQAVTSVRVGGFIAGWSRMVLDIDRPLTIVSAGIDTETGTVSVDLLTTDPASFGEQSGTPLAARSPVIDPMPTPLQQRQDGQRPLVVVLDPGHGGIDPGAESGGNVEAELMLVFARELRETLLRAGVFQVVLTREQDEFVPLEARISLARQAKADVFLSLHADALVEGRASGATIYTLSNDASDAATRKLAERHDRSDLLSGVDLSQQDDVIATVLMDMARTETAPRSHRLAKALVAGLSETVGVHKRPHLSAGFSVLKAPDIPSVLIELGFLSSKRDRERLLDQEWRTQAAIGIREALLNWRVSDADDAKRVRN